MHPPPTLGTLAQELGLSRSAVSMALRNHPEISAEVKRRVRALADLRGYRPDPALSRIRTKGARRTKGMPLAVVREAAPRGRHALYEDKMLDRLAEIARGYGYHLSRFDVKSSEGAAGMNRVLKARGIEPVILTPMHSPAFRDSFDWASFSVVACGAGFVELPCHRVAEDVGHAIRRSVEILLERGYRRIACVVHPSDGRRAVDHADKFGMLAFMRTEVEALGGRLEVATLARDDVKGLARLLRLTRADAVLAQHNGYWWALRDLGLKVPEKMGFVAWAASAGGGQQEPISGFVSNGMLVGAAAIQLLDAELRQFRRGVPPSPTRQLVQLNWQEGVTLRAAPGGGAAAATETR